MNQAPAAPAAAVIEQWLVAHLAATVAVDPAEIDVHLPFDSYGVSSRDAVLLSGELEQWLNRPLPATLVYAYPTVALLAAHLAGADGEGKPLPGRLAEPPPALRAGGPGEAIAIVGIGLRFPGASTPGAFWQLLREGVDAIREVPADRWDKDAYYDPEGVQPGKVNTRWGGFLERVDYFDPAFFSISPREASRIDPQQRLLLEVCWEALEDAGILPSRLRGSQTGVFVGISSNDYAHFQFARPEWIDAYAGTGNAHSIAANRLSFLLDLRGPSMAIDTACSSSLVAVHVACNSLRMAECELALVGGVNLMLTPAVTINFTRAGVMSPRGRSRPFDAAADGYVRGEGAAVVVLKALAQAMEDGDRIYAVIRGSAINQDGRSNGMMAPNPASQQAVLRQAYRNAGITAAAVQYVECHGTGTLLGDPIEANALGAVLAEGGRRRACAIGSVKSNIGHLEAAAGVAGLTKVALALQQRALPPSLHFREPNPHIDFERLPLRVVTRLEPWPAVAGPAVAGVSSFGFGGTNVHLIVEEAPLGPSRLGTERSGVPWVLLPLSARNEPALQEQARAYRKLLQEEEGGSLADIVYTAAARRDHHAHRLAVVGDSRQPLIAGLDAFVAGERALMADSGNDGRRPVFVFPGQGGQWPGMGRDLLESQPVFAATIQRCEEALSPILERSVLASLRDGLEMGDAVEQVQPVLFAVQVALAAVWRSWGVEPAAVVGHSMGEVAAACVAGALTLEEGAAIICQRSRLMAGARGRGSMLAVQFAPARLGPWLARYSGRVTVAVHNSPDSCVLSGDSDALAALGGALAEAGIFCRPVPVDVAAHSEQMEALQAPLRQALEGLAPRAAAVPLYSTVSGGLIAGERLDADYWAENLRQPVRFAAATDALLAEGFETFIEMNAHPILLTPIRQTAAAGGKTLLSLPSLRREEPGEKVLLESLATLYQEGVTPNWQGVFPTGGQVVSLPPYPWQRQRYWFEEEAEPERPAMVAMPSQPPEEWFYTVAWEEAALAAGENEVRGGRWLIFADEGGCGGQLVSALTEQGSSCVVVTRAAKYAAPAEDGQIARYELNPLVPGQWEQLVQDVQAGGGECTGIVYLWALDAPETAPEAESGWEAVETVAAAAPLHLVQALAAARWPDAPRLWLVTRQAQAAGGGALAVQPNQALLWGLGRTVRHELPQFRCSMIDIGEGDVQVVAGEVAADGPEGQVAYRGTTRYVARLRRLREDGSGEGVPAGLDGEGAVVRVDGTYLISGGLGGLGLEVAEWLVGAGARSLVLLGRGAGSPEAQARLERLRVKGARVEAVQVDVSQREALAAVLAGVRAELPPLRGVIHAAAILSDGILLQQRWDRFRGVFPAKVEGGWNLHALTGADPLDFFVLFSSVASLLGSPGQANYAAANAFLDVLAEERRREGRPALSINWGPWADAGLAASEELRRRFERWGMGMIAPATGIAALSRLVAAAGRDEVPAEVMVLEIAWSQAAASFPSGDSDPFFAHFVSAMPARRETVAAAGGRQAPGDRGGMERYLRALLAQVLHVPAAQIVPTATLPSLGLDSLMTMEVLRHVQQELGVHLYPREVLERPTVAALADYLSAEVAGDRAKTDAAQGMVATGEGLLGLANEPGRFGEEVDERNPSLAFLLSAPRSGSTLLRVMLAGHPELFVPPELHLLSFNTMQEWRAGLEKTYVGEGVEIAFGRLLALDGDGSRAYVDALVRENEPVQRVYRRLQERVAPRLLVDKSPSYGRSPGVLARAEVLFDRPRYIFLTRHPYSVIESIVRMRFERLLGAGEVEPYAFAEQVWTTINGNIADFLATGDPARYHVVRYEELVADPRGELAALCSFLQIPFDEAVLHPYEGERMTGGLYANSLPIGDPNFAGYQKVDRSRADVWKQVELPRPLGAVARRVAEELGYEVPGARLRLRGEAMGEGTREQGEPAATGEPSALVALQPEGDRPPLFLIHPGGGTVFPYYELARALGTERPVYGLQDLSLDGVREPAPSIEAYAADYVEVVRSFRPHGPYYLGGWSFGGQVALEMAQRFRAAGEAVPFLLMLDTEAPVGGRALSVRQRLGYLKNRIMEYVAGAPDLIPYIRDALFLIFTYQGRKQRERAEMGMVEYFRWAQKEGLRKRMEGIVPLARTLAEDKRFQEVELPGTSVRRGLWLLRYHMKIVNRYEPAVYPGKLTFLRATEQVARKYYRDEALGWREMVSGGVEVVPVAGNHMTLFQEPVVHEVAAAIKACLAREEAEQGPVPEAVSGGG